ncbi:SEC-C metal-binding domain-containing protein [Serinicoccus kebangsaanensis]|uniref:SEC-C metal-binding domain-containing protein n=1 Tax=Serinicoccus kebangsaanensis TaxID=2602069 RepID=UPI00124F3B4E
MPRIEHEEPCPCGSGSTYGACHFKKYEDRRPPIKDHVRLTLIQEPDPGTRAVFERTEGGSLIFQGRETSYSYDCSACGAPLAVGINLEQIQGTVLKCSSCDAYNDTVEGAKS